MTAKPKPMKAVSAAERQAASTLQSAREVVAEIEGHRNLLADQGQSTEMRRYAKRELVEASERLCNLMALTIEQIANGGDVEFHNRLKDAVDELRGRLLDMSTKLLIEKMAKIQQRADEVLKDGGYPIGLSSKLEHAYAGILHNMGTLGALNKLGEKDRSLVDDTAKSLKTLTENENKLYTLSHLKEQSPN